MCSQLTPWFSICLVSSRAVAGNCVVKGDAGLVGEERRRL